MSNNVPVATSGEVLRPCLNLCAKELSLVPREGSVGEEAEISLLRRGSLGLVARGGAAEIPADISPVAGGKFDGKFAVLGKAI